MLTNKKNLNEAILRAISRNWYSGFGEHRDFSVTELLNPPKIYHLMKRHADEIEEDMSERIFMLMGSAMHAILERANESDAEFEIISRVRWFFDWIHNNPTVSIQVATEKLFSTICGENSKEPLNNLIPLMIQERYLIEKRFSYITQSGYHITGGIDLYDREKRELHDYKLTSVWTYIYRNRPGSRMEDWTDQLNMYRLFLDASGYDVDKIFVNLIFKDYSKSKAKIERDYPNEIETIELPLFGLDVVEQMLENKIENIMKYKNTLDNGIPACNSKERWQQQDTWAVKKHTNKTASKVLFSYADARKWLEEEISKIAERDIAKGMDVDMAMRRASDLFAIEKREGIPTRCVDYCPVAQFCNFYHELPEGMK